MSDDPIWDLTEKHLMNNGQLLETTPDANAEYYGNAAQTGVTPGVSTAPDIQPKQKPAMQEADPSKEVVKPMSKVPTRTSGPSSIDEVMGHIYGGKANSMEDKMHQAMSKVKGKR